METLPPTMETTVLSYGRKSNKNTCGSKEMDYQAMKRHGGNLNAYYQVKETNLKRLHMEDPLSSGPCFVRTLHHDLSTLGGPTQHSSW